MSIESTLEYIHSVKWQNMKPGLERIRELLAALGNPEKRLKFVHIAGTNGKGSTAACIASVLRRAGYRTGLYISPYILTFNERMQVDGENITDAELERLTDEIRPFADAMTDTPTEFEIITALAMQFFVDNACDIVVLEVGMGGELDSTNVIDTPEVAVITAIGFDHVKELGPELVDVARAKAGIIKPGGDVVIYGGEPEVETVFEEMSRSRGAALHRTDFSRVGAAELSLERARFDIAPYGTVALPLVGTYQPKNAAVAVTALEVLRGKGYVISDAQIVEGLEAVRWPGRFEVISRAPTFILDGSHNVHGMQATAESIKLHFPDCKIVFLTGVMADKDVSAMMSLIAPFAERFITVTPPNPRAMKAAELADRLAQFGVPVSAAGTIDAGVREAIAAAGERGVVCALGSFYFSAEVREAVNNNV